LPTAAFAAYSSVCYCTRCTEGVGVLVRREAVLSAIRGREAALSANRGSRARGLLVVSARSLG
jgi:hypothetical protein